MSSHLRVGIVGFGGAGLALHQHFARVGGCRVTAIFDSKPAGLDWARATAGDGCQLTDDYASFLASGLDAVVVCSPDSTHAGYVASALRAGKHVLCEKPLTDSPAGCREILQAERAAPGCVAAVQHQMRFVPVHTAMQDTLASHRLGPVFYLEGYYVHNLVERARQYDSWRFDEQAHPLVYAGCHFVDLFRWWPVEEVVEIIGMANHLAFPEYPECDMCGCCCASGPAR